MSATHQRPRTRHSKTVETRGKEPTNGIATASGPRLGSGSSGANKSSTPTRGPGHTITLEAPRRPAPSAGAPQATVGTALAVGAATQREGLALAAATAPPQPTATPPTATPPTATPPTATPPTATPPTATPATAPAPTPAAPTRPHVSAAPGYHRATFLKGFVYAWNGLIYAIRTQRNARIHAAIATLAVLMGIWLRISPVEFAMVFVAITAVFIAEMFNTVAEACVDMITNTYHPLARIAKDVAAGAVLLNAMLSVVIGLLVFVPHLWPLVIHLVGPLFAHGHGG